MERKAGAWETLNKFTILQRWRLLDSPVGSNENPKLELPGAWEPTSSGCSLSPCEGKSSQNFVSNGNKEICSRDEADLGGPSLSWHVSSTQCPTLWRSGFIVDGGDRATCPNFHS